MIWLSRARARAPLELSVSVAKRVDRNLIDSCESARLECAGLLGRARARPLEMRRRPAPFDGHVTFDNLECFCFAFASPNAAHVADHQWTPVSYFGPLGLFV